MPSLNTLKSLTSILRLFLCYLCLSGVTCGTILSLQQPCLGDEGTEKGADKFPIATVRIDLVLRDYAPFAKQMQEFQNDRKSAQEELEVQQAEAETVFAKLRMTPPGSPQHDDLQREAAKLQTQLRQQVERATQQFQRREAKMFIEIFAKIDVQLKMLAKKHGLKMILRKQEVELREDLPAPLFQQALNRLVLLDDTEDLTAELLAALKEAESPAKP